MTLSAGAPNVTGRGALVFTVGLRAYLPACSHLAARAQVVLDVLRTCWMSCARAQFGRRERDWPITLRCAVSREERAQD